MSKESVPTIGGVGASSAVSLGLPEPGRTVLEVTFACLDVELVEGGKNADGFYLTVGFPESFDGGVEVLTDGVGTGIPKPYFFSQRIGQRVI